MELFKKELRFNSKTGQPLDPVKVWKETRCDFTGKIVASSEDKYNNNYYCKFQLDYEDQDSCMGADGLEYDFGQKYGIYMFQFLSDPYVIFEDWETGESYQNKFLKAATKYESLDHALRMIRIKTATKLLEKGTIKPEELSGAD